MNGTLTVGSLFSGIGGFDLGLERAGMRTVWFCEQDRYRQRVLARHWPGVPCYSDVSSLVADPECYGGTDERQGDAGNKMSAGVGTGGAVGGGPVAREHGGDDDGRHGRQNTGAGGAGVSVRVPYVDVLCGGFPCQDISVAGRGEGIGGARSGLWGQFARLVGELRPRYVLVENVPALTSRGLDVVLADLAACGFDAEWDCLPASAFGAPHRRDRIWLVAYPSIGGDGAEVLGGEAGGPDSAGPSGGVGGSGDGSGAPELADSAGEAWDTTGPFGPEGAGGSGPLGEFARPDWWLVEPGVGRVAHGIPNRVDRLAALGDSLVPQIAEWIGHRIVAYEAQTPADMAGLNEVA